MTLTTTRLIKMITTTTMTILLAFGILPTAAAGWIHHHHYSHVGSRRGTLLKSQAESTTQVQKDSSSSSLTLFSPSKINLFLRILRKRPHDGYHDLASLFQAVGFGDTLELKIADSDSFSCNMPGVPRDSSNLVLRALDLMREKTGNERVSFRADLIKQVPAQAGLGGGSANAATAMWGVNELLNRPATMEEMIQWSGELGSDITFFLSRGTAYCTGRGEIMSPIDPPLKAGTKLVIVKPKYVGLSTPAVFQALDYDSLSTLDPREMLNAFLENDSPSSRYYHNDLEQAAFACLPELQELKRELQQVSGFTNVLMSGSGTSIFCLGEPDDRKAFGEAFEQRDDLQVFFTQFITREQDGWYQKPE